MGEERHQTPAHHLEELLARAQNPFDVSDRVLHRLRSAVMFRVELRGWSHHNTPRPTLRCSSFRHVFLLADGSSLLLWELCYDSEDSRAAGGTELCEVYDCEESLRRSERRVHRWMGANEDPDESPVGLGLDDAGTDGGGWDGWDGGDGGDGWDGGETANGPCGPEADGAGRPAGSADRHAPEEELDGFADEGGPGGFGDTAFGGPAVDGPRFGDASHGGPHLGSSFSGGAHFDGSHIAGVPFDASSSFCGLPAFDPSAPEEPPLDASALDGPPCELTDEGPPFEDRRFDDPVFGSLTAAELCTEDGEPGTDQAPDDLELDPLAERGGGPARLSFEFLVAASGTGREPREYAERGSPDHARRLLRRAENEDRPGAETLRLLDKALGHQILHVPGPLAAAGECHVWCSVYEHAFLLPDGSEVSLYELEHNLSGSGRLVCEVYLEESVAGQAAHRLARDRGMDL